ncbi:hypothetical protein ScPMuIL_015086 [Solemya velum]
MSKDNPGFAPTIQPNIPPDSLQPPPYAQYNPYTVPVQNQNTQYNAQYTVPPNVVTMQAHQQPGLVYNQPHGDYMVSAILVTLFCFWPTGILAIMKASEANSAAARGDMLTANTKGEEARRMIRYSVLIGVIAFVALAVILGISYGVAFSS